MVGGALKLIFGWAQQKVSSTTLLPLEFLELKTRYKKFLLSKNHLRLSEQYEIISLLIIGEKN